MLCIIFKWYKEGKEYVSRTLVTQFSQMLSLVTMKKEDWAHSVFFFVSKEYNNIFIKTVKVANVYRANIGFLESMGLCGIAKNILAPIQ